MYVLPRISVLSGSHGQTQSAYDPAVHLLQSDLSLSDLSLTSASDLKAKIEASKIDPFGASVSIFLGRTDKAICPVSALLGYVSRQRTAPGPLSHLEDGHLLTRDAFVR